MIKPNIKADLHSIAEHISPDASYTDAMYELYYPHENRSRKASRR